MFDGVTWGISVADLLKGVFDWIMLFKTHLLLGAIMIFGSHLISFFIFVLQVRGKDYEDIDYSKSYYRNYINGQKESWKWAINKVRRR